MSDERLDDQTEWRISDVCDTSAIFMIDRADAKKVAKQDALAALRSRIRFLIEKAREEGRHEMWVESRLNTRGVPHE